MPGSVELRSSYGTAPLAAPIAHICSTCVLKQHGSPVIELCHHLLNVLLWHLPTATVLQAVHCSVELWILSLAGLIFLQQAEQQQ